MDSFDDVASIPGTSTQATPPATPPNPELRRIFGVQYPDANFVRRTADVCGVSTALLDDKVAGHVADALRSHLKEVIKEAVRFTVHGRRARMIPQDLDDALRLMGVQPLYGIRSGYGEPFRFSGSGGKELVWRDDGLVDLTPLINAPPPRMPLEPRLKPHWLVIDGVQPAVPENPVPPGPLGILTGVGSAGGGSAGREERTEGGAMARTLTTHTLSLEQQVFFKEIVESVIGHDADKRNEALHCLQTDYGLQSMAPRFALTIVEGVRTNIGCRNLHCLQQLLLMTHALMNNRSVSMSKVVHDLLPAVLSCCVARRLSARPALDNHWAAREAAAKLVARMCNATDAGVMRTRVSHLYMKAFGPKGVAGKPTCKRAPMATLYGAVFGIAELGLETVRTLIVPRAPWLYDECQRAIEGIEEEAKPEEKKPRDPSAIDEEEASQDESGVDTQNDEKKAARKMIDLITSVLIKYVRATRPSSLRDLSDYTQQLGGFASAVYKETVTDMPTRAPGSAQPSVPPLSSSSHPIRSTPTRLPVAQQVQRSRPAPSYGYGAAAPSGYRPASGQPKPPALGGTPIQGRYL